MDHRIIQGDCIEGLRTLPDASVHCCVTSPPYWGLRDYGHDGQNVYRLEHAEYRKPTLPPGTVEWKPEPPEVKR